MKRFAVVFAIVFAAFCAVQAQNPEPTGWFAGDMHVHRSCGGAPESVSTMFSRMSPENLAVESLLADSGNGEVQDATTDLPRVNGQDDPISTPNQILHWDAEWHWDATYTQYPHQALGGHIVTLGLSGAQQLWQEYTYPILDWAHQHNGIAGFAHLQYLDGNGLPNSLTCCTPIEYPVEVALGAADFISEDVDDVNQTAAVAGNMHPEAPIQAYYRLLNSGFRPGLAAGTDYPCNGADNGGALGGLLTYVQIPSGQLTYRNWIQGIADGRTVVSRDGHNEFLNLKVNGTSTPGDEIRLTGPGSVSVTIEWTAAQNWSGTIELVQNGTVVASKQASAGPGVPATLTTTVNFSKSGWLAARRMGINPQTGNYEHYVHTAAVFVIVNNQPIRASQADAQYYVDWTNGLLQNTSPGGIWNSFFPTDLAAAQGRYQAAKALFEQIVKEAQGNGPTLSSIAVTPANSTAVSGSTKQFVATGTYSDGTSLNITAQVTWASSNTYAASINSRGLATALNTGATMISATQGNVTGSTSLSVQTDPLAITTQSLPGGTVSVAYSTTLGASGGITPYVWSIASGSLPAGLALNASTGVISGTPTVTGTFNVTVQVSDSETPAQVVSKALSITISSVGGNCPCSIWPGTTAPSIADAGPDSPVELGVQFRSDISGYITGVRFYKSTANTGTHVGNLWTAGGTRLATATFTGESASGWQQVSFSTPVPITAGTTYVASYHTTVGHYAYDQYYFTNQGTDNSPLHAPQDTSSTHNGVFVYGSGGFPNQPWTSTNYWVDVVFVPTAAPLAITTQSLPGGSVNVAYSTTLAASGGTAPYAWSIAGGALPAGLALNASTGVISGTPTVTGTFNVTVQVSDSETPAQTVSKALSITISSVGGNCPCSIWPGTTAPSIADAGPDSPVELGVQFRSDVDGYITGVRFYKGTGNTGTHVGNLWTAGGTLLATATFTGESASGWQQVSFSTPVPITAGTAYVASYHTTVGHYAYDQYYFANQGVDNSPLHALQDTSSTHNGVFVYGAGGFPNEAWTSTNYWVDVAFVPAGGGTTPPTVVSVSPAAGATNVDTFSAITATFSEALDPTTVNGTSVQLLDPSSSLVNTTVTYNPTDNTVTLTPSEALLNSTTYEAVMKGGIIKDSLGNALTTDYTWTFTTAAALPVPPSEGPGGPVLIVSSSTNPFSRYYVEILRAEGFNEYKAMDISLVSASTLDAYDVVILGNFALTAQQASMFSNWVNNGGNLIAMRPDKQLAAMLGLTDTGAVLSDAYILINTSSGPGQGLVGETIQFHGTADRYTANGATILATLYSNATASTGNPAVTLHQVGLGQAAAFTYDLARSVVYTRQGNPAWSGEPRDGLTGPIRPDDLYYGAASFDPQPDYVDHNKIAIPQADEQQRLLANLIIQMNLAKQPLPRFWYFPRDLKAAVVMTGDDHGAMYGGGATAARFDHYLSLSPAGCSVDDWQCVRASAYLIAPSIASNPLTNAQAGYYVSQGFEVGVHIDSVPDCSNWTTSELASLYPSQISSFMSTYPSVPKPKTHRMHCISWSDYNSQPQVELQNGIRLDTSYYYWPPSWVNDTPGMFTGSGMPMRFAKSDGTMVDVYQAATQMTDESGQSYPLNIDTLLDNALGTKGYYGFFTANMHNDSATSDGADQIIASAQARGVPVISAAQLLTWLDGRNGSSFTSPVWNGSTLTFGIAVAAGANGLRAMLPANSSSGSLSSISLNGNNVPFTLETIKGILYAVFPATAGSYQATYAANTNIAIASVAMNPSTVVGGTNSTGTVNLNGPAPNGGIAVALSSSNPSVASVPTSVTVTAGSTSASFTATTSAVSVQTNVTVTATYGSSMPATLTVSPQALSSLSNLSLNPVSVPGGSTSIGTVTLSGPAGTGGATVALSSNNSGVATVPASVIVGAGSTTATFTITTTAVATSTTVSITASYGGSSTSQSLTVTAATGLSTVTLNPTSVIGSNPSTGTVTLAQAAPTGGVVVSLSSANPAVASVPSSVTIGSGNTTAAFTVTTYAVSVSTGVSITATYGAGQSATLTVNPPTPSSVTLNPSSVTAGNTSTATVTLSGPAPAGGATVSLASGNSAAATVPASVVVNAGSTTATFTVSTSAALTASTSVTISATYAGSSVSALLTITPAALSTLALSPASVVGGNTSTGTVTLTAAAPAGGIVVNLSSSNASVANVPTTVTVAAGNTTASFTITTTPVATQTAVGITAAYRTISSTATLTVVPPELSALLLSSNNVVGGDTLTGTVQLNGAAQAGGVTVALSSADTTIASVPASVTVPQGATSASFTITTYPVSKTTKGSISASYGATVQTATFNLKRAR